MHLETIPARTQTALALLARGGVTGPFCLAGGTAVALHLGHRISADLDFFGPDEFDAPALRARLEVLGEYHHERTAENTLLGTFEGTRISFFQYRYPWLDAPLQVLDTSVAGLPDLAAMKIEAVAGRNARRDFVDLYFLARAGYPPEKAFQLYRQKYAGYDLNLYHAAKALGVFDEADAQPMPKMLVKVSWMEVKQYFSSKSRELMRQLIEEE